MTSRFMGFYTFVCNCRYLKLIPFQKIYDTISKSDLVNLTMKPYVMMVLSKKPIVYELLKMKYTTKSRFSGNVSILDQKSCCISNWEKTDQSFLMLDKSVEIRRLQTKKYLLPHLDRYYVCVCMDGRKRERMSIIKKATLPSHLCSVVYMHETVT